MGRISRNIIIILVLLVAASKVNIDHFADKYNEQCLSEYEKIVEQNNTSKERYQSSVKQYDQKMSEYEERLHNVEVYQSTGEVPIQTIVVKHESAGGEGIGNDLSYYFYVNGQNAEDVRTININKKYSFCFKVEEWDATYPDIGSTTINKTFSVEELKDGVTIRIRTSARETRGRDAGNVAKFDGYFTIKAQAGFATSADELQKPKEPKKPTYKEAVLEQTSGLEILTLDSKAMAVESLVVIIAAIGFILECRKARVQAIERAKFQQEKQRFIDSLEGKPLRVLAGVPQNVRFVNGFPVDNNDKPYGNFTVYLSKNGYRYHRTQGCSSAHYPEHIIRACMREYRFCRKCCSSPYNYPKWYVAYRDLIKKLDSYGISEQAYEKKYVKPMETLPKNPSGETKTGVKIELKPKMVSSDENLKKSAVIKANNSKEKEAITMATPVQVVPAKNVVYQDRSHAKQKKTGNAKAKKNGNLKDAPQKKVNNIVPSIDFGDEITLSYSGRSIRVVLVEKHVEYLYCAESLHGANSRFKIAEKYDSNVTLPNNVMIITSLSPVGKKLLGKKSGDKISVNINGQITEYKIENIKKNAARKISQ